jgi:hypothetical protein
VPEDPADRALPPIVHLLDGHDQGKEAFAGKGKAVEDGRESGVRRAWAVSAIAAMLVLTGVAQAWQVPLTATEPAKVAGWRPISVGVPLLAGQAREPGELRLVVRDASGRLTPVPAQFRVLARWWRADHSIRWVLVDCAADFQPGETKTFILTNDALDAPAPKPAVACQETPETITITTGPARFVVSKRQFAFLQRALIDANRDGLFTDDEDVLATTSDCGSVVEDTFGEKYYAADGTESVVVQEAGPLRVTVRAKGRHLARGGKGYSKGMYGYDATLNFYAGSPDVYVDYVVTNNPAKPIGSPTFDDASLVLRLKGGASGYSLTGMKAAQTGLLNPGQSVCLYQDSNGAETWKTCSGFARMFAEGWSPLPDPGTTFRGYRILSRSGEQEAELSAGDRARGLLQATNAGGGVILHTRHFWQQFPKAAEVFADGRVRLGLFPKEFRLPHYLEDASAKGHEIALRFFKGPAPSAAAFADAWDALVYPRPPLEHIAATGALSDIGPYSVPTPKSLEVRPDNRTQAENARMFTDDRLYGNAYGWQVFGERWRSNGGHSSRGARQPISEDNYLFRWYVSGSQEWFWAGYNRSRQFRDVRQYRIDGQDPFGFDGWNAFRRANWSEDYCSRPQPSDDEYQKYSEGRWGRSGWFLPNPAHMVLDLCYDRYLLFGDQRAYENLRLIAAHGGYYVSWHQPFVHRESGWCWRTLERYWELTGDEVAKKFLLLTLTKYEPLIGKKPLMSYNDVNKNEYNWWFTQVFSRAIAMTALHLRDPRALALCKTQAETDREIWAPGSPNKPQYGYFATLFSVLYHLTGDESYKKDVLGAGAGEGLLRAPTGDDVPASSHWLLNQPPKPLAGA